MSRFASFLAVVCVSLVISGVLSTPGKDIEACTETTGCPATQQCCSPTSCCPASTSCCMDGVYCCRGNIHFLAGETIPLPK